MKVTRLKIAMAASLAAIFVVGPATMTTRTLSIGANEILGWRRHELCRAGPEESYFGF